MQGSRRAQQRGEPSFLATIPASRLLEIAKLIRNPLSGVYVSDRRSLLMRVTKCFVGSEAIDWMLANLQEITQRREGVELGQLFLDCHVFRPFGGPDLFEDKDSLYRFLDEEEDGVLNPRKLYVCDSPQEPCALSALLLTALTDLARKEGDKQGTEAEQYLTSLKSSDAYSNFLGWASELHRVSLDRLDENTKKVFWLNIYNTLALHGTIVKGPLFARNPLQRPSFFKTSCYSVGGIVYSLDDIEHGILRANRSIAGTSEYFRSYDERSKYSVQSLDARVHFLLNCCTCSSPPVAVLTRDNVEQFLKHACKAYLAQHTTLDTNKIMIMLPKVCDWYKRDFGANNFEVIKWLFHYLGVEQKKAVNMLSGLGYVSLKYTEYSWTLALPKRLELPAQQRQVSLASSSDNISLVREGTRFVDEEEATEGGSREESEGEKEKEKGPEPVLSIFRRTFERNRREMSVTGQGVQAASVPPEAYACLIYAAGRLPSLPLPQYFVFDKAVIKIGRQKEDVDVWLDSTQCKNMISRFHATVTYLPESFSWKITDGSVNGIAINDVKRKEAILRDNDVLTFGGMGGAPEGTIRRQPSSEFVYRFRSPVVPPSQALSQLGITSDQQSNLSQQSQPLPPSVVSQPAQLIDKQQPAVQIREQPAPSHPLPPQQQPQPIPPPLQPATPRVQQPVQHTQYLQPAIPPQPHTTQQQQEHPSQAQTQLTQSLPHSPQSGLRTEEQPAEDDSASFVLFRQPTQRPTSSEDSEEGEYASTTTTNNTNNNNGHTDLDTTDIVEADSETGDEGGDDEEKEESEGVEKNNKHAGKKRKQQVLKKPRDTKRRKLKEEDEEEEEEEEEEKEDEEKEEEESTSASGLSQSNTAVCICKKQTVTDSFWIACDYCNGWYHGKCVNISPEEADKLDSFKCPRCKEANKEDNDEDTTTTTTTTTTTRQDSASSQRKKEKARKKEETMRKKTFRKGQLIACLADPTSGDTFWLCKVAKRATAAAETLTVSWFEKHPNNKVGYYVAGKKDVINKTTIISDKLTSKDFSTVGDNHWRLSNKMRERLLAKA